ncbi:hypothetical protein Val02_59370 [Virgisporangium aliadipatigenens]|uniref:Uncharacterized protein n=1 Tax=Virgisporangium aliadipatigenens TaxID=741659 RepID=A0A8J3YPJ7_9ACTN|nr:hypothetical protein [Virgisporangium aliadipatigenens]GIJ49051.1 hypothetical protein Val02_59370 [Virgisporangium aliadipatigenens]
MTSPTMEDCLGDRVIAAGAGVLYLHTGDPGTTPPTAAVERAAAATSQPGTIQVHIGPIEESSTLLNRYFAKRPAATRGQMVLHFDDTVPPDVAERLAARYGVRLAPPPGTAPAPAGAKKKRRKKPGAARAAQAGASSAPPPAAAPPAGPPVPERELNRVIALVREGRAATLTTRERWLRDALRTAVSHTGWSAGWPLRDMAEYLLTLNLVMRTDDLAHLTRPETIQAMLSNPKALEFAGRIPAIALIAGHRPDLVPFIAESERWRLDVLNQPAAAPALLSDPTLFDRALADPEVNDLVDDFIRMVGPVLGMNPDIFGKVGDDHRMLEALGRGPSGTVWARAISRIPQLRAAIMGSRLPQRVLENALGVASLPAAALAAGERLRLDADDWREILTDTAFLSDLYDVPRVLPALVVSPALMRAAQEHDVVLEQLATRPDGLRLVDLFFENPPLADRFGAEPQLLKTAVDNPAVVQRISADPKPFVRATNLGAALRDATAPAWATARPAVARGNDPLARARAASPALAAALSSGAPTPPPAMLQYLADHPKLLDAPHEYRRLLHKPELFPLLLEHQRAAAAMARLPADARREVTEGVPPSGDLVRMLLRYPFAWERLVGVLRPELPYLLRSLQAAPANVRTVTHRAMYELPSYAWYAAMLPTALVGNATFPRFGPHLGNGENFSGITTHRIVGNIRTVTARGDRNAENVWRGLMRSPAVQRLVMQNREAGQVLISGSFRDGFHPLVSWQGSAVLDDYPTVLETLNRIGHQPGMTMNHWAYLFADADLLPWLERALADENPDRPVAQALLMPDLLPTVTGSDDFRELLADEGLLDAIRRALREGGSAASAQLRTLIERNLPRLLTADGEQTDNPETAELMRTLTGGRTEFERALDAKIAAERADGDEWDEDEAAENRAVVLATYDRLAGADTAGLRDLVRRHPTLAKALLADSELFDLYEDRPSVRRILENSAAARRLTVDRDFVAGLLKNDELYTRFLREGDQFRKDLIAYPARREALALNPEYARAEPELADVVNASTDAFHLVADDDDITRLALRHEYVRTALRQGGELLTKLFDGGSLVQRVVLGSEVLLTAVRRDPALVDRLSTQGPLLEALDRHPGVVDRFVPVPPAGRQLTPAMENMGRQAFAAILLSKPEFHEGLAGASTETADLLFASPQLLQFVVDKAPGLVEAIDRQPALADLVLRPAVRKLLLKEPSLADDLVEDIDGWRGVLRDSVGLADRLTASPPLLDALRAHKHLRDAAERLRPLAADLAATAGPPLWSALAAHPELAGVLSGGGWRAMRTNTELLRTLSNERVDLGAGPEENAAAWRTLLSRGELLRAVETDLSRGDLTPEALGPRLADLAAREEARRAAATVAAPTASRPHTYALPERAKRGTAAERAELTGAAGRRAKAAPQPATEPRAVRELREWWRREGTAGQQALAGPAGEALATALAAHPELLVLLRRYEHLLEQVVADPAAVDGLTFARFLGRGGYSGAGGFEHDFGAWTNAIGAGAGAELRDAARPVWERRDYRRRKDEHDELVALERRIAEFEPHVRDSWEPSGTVHIHDDVRDSLTDADLEVLHGIAAGTGGPREEDFEIQINVPLHQHVDRGANGVSFAYVVNEQWSVDVFVYSRSIGRKGNDYKWPREGGYTSGPAGMDRLINGGYLGPSRARVRDLVAERREAAAQGILDRTPPRRTAPAEVPENAYDALAAELRQQPTGVHLGGPSRRNRATQPAQQGESGPAQQAVLKPLPERELTKIITTLRQGRRAHVLASREKWLRDALRTAVAGTGWRDNWPIAQVAEYLLTLHQAVRSNDTGHLTRPETIQALLDNPKALEAAGATPAIGLVAGHRPDLVPAIAASEQWRDEVLHDFRAVPALLADPTVFDEALADPAVGDLVDDYIRFIAAILGQNPTLYKLIGHNRDLLEALGRGPSGTAWARAMVAVPELREAILGAPDPVRTLENAVGLASLPAAALAVEERVRLSTADWREVLDDRAFVSALYAAPRALPALVVSPDLMRAARTDPRVLALLGERPEGVRLVDVLLENPKLVDRLAADVTLLETAVRNPAVAQVLSEEPTRFDRSQDLGSVLRNAKAPAWATTRPTRPRGNDLLARAKAASPALAAALATGAPKPDPAMLQYLVEHPKLLDAPHEYRRLLHKPELFAPLLQHRRHSAELARVPENLRGVVAGVPPSGDLVRALLRYPFAWERLVGIRVPDLPELLDSMRDAPADARAGTLRGMFEVPAFGWYAALLPGVVRNSIVFPRFGPQTGNAESHAGLAAHKMIHNIRLLTGRGDDDSRRIWTHLLASPAALRLALQNRDAAQAFVSGNFDDGRHPLVPYRGSAVLTDFPRVLETLNRYGFQPGMTMDHWQDFLAEEDLLRFLENALSGEPGRAALAEALLSPELLPTVIGSDELHLLLDGPELLDLLQQTLERLPREAALSQLRTLLAEQLPRLLTDDGEPIDNPETAALMRTLTGDRAGFARAVDAKLAAERADADEWEEDEAAENRAVFMSYFDRLAEPGMSGLRTLVARFPTLAKAVMMRSELFDLYEDRPSVRRLLSTSPAARRLTVDAAFVSALLTNDKLYARFLGEGELFRRELVTYESRRESMALNKEYVHAELHDDTVAVLNSGHEAFRLISEDDDITRLAMRHGYVRDVFTQGGLLLSELLDHGSVVQKVFVSNETLLRAAHQDAERVRQLRAQAVSVGVSEEDAADAHPTLVARLNDRPVLLYALERHNDLFDRLMPANAKDRAAQVERTFRNLTADRFYEPFARASQETVDLLFSSPDLLKFAQMVPALVDAVGRQPGIAEVAARPAVRNLLFRHHELLQDLVEHLESWRGVLRDGRGLAERLSADPALLAAMRAHPHIRQVAERVRTVAADMIAAGGPPLWTAFVPNPGLAKAVSGTGWKGLRQHTALLRALSDRAVDLPAESWRVLLARLDDLRAIDTELGERALSPDGLGQRLRHVVDAENARRAAAAPTPRAPGTRGPTYPIVERGKRGTAAERAERAGPSRSASEIVAERAPSTAHLSELRDLWLGEGTPTRAALAGPNGPRIARKLAANPELIVLLARYDDTGEMLERAVADPDSLDALTFTAFLSRPGNFTAAPRPGERERERFERDFGRWTDRVGGAELRDVAQRTWSHHEYAQHRAAYERAAAIDTRRRKFEPHRPGDWAPSGEVHLHEDVRDYISDWDLRALRAIANGSTPREGAALNSPQHTHTDRGAHGISFAYVLNEEWKVDVLAYARSIGRKGNDYKWSTGGGYTSGPAGMDHLNNDPLVLPSRRMVREHHERQADPDRVPPAPTAPAEPPRTAYDVLATELATGVHLGTAGPAVERPAPRATNGFVFGTAGSRDALRMPTDARAQAFRMRMADRSAPVPGAHPTLLVDANGTPVPEAALAYLRAVVAGIEPRLDRAGAAGGQKPGDEWCVDVLVAARGALFDRTGIPAGRTLDDAALRPDRWSQWGPGRTWPRVPGFAAVSDLVGAAGSTGRVGFVLADGPNGAPGHAWLVTRAPSGDVVWLDPTNPHVAMKAVSDAAMRGRAAMSTRALVFESDGRPVPLPRTLESDSPAAVGALAGAGRWGLVGGELETMVRVGEPVVITAENKETFSANELPDFGVTLGSITRLAIEIKVDARPVFLGASGVWYSHQHQLHLAGDRLVRNEVWQIAEVVYLPGAAVGGEWRETETATHQHRRAVEVVAWLEEAGRQGFSVTQALTPFREGLGATFDAWYGARMAQRPDNRALADLREAFTETRDGLVPWVNENDMTEDEVLWQPERVVDERIGIQTTGGVPAAGVISFLRGVERRSTGLFSTPEQAAAGRSARPFDLVRYVQRMSIAVSERVARDYAQALAFGPLGEEHQRTLLGFEESLALRGQIVTAVTHIMTLVTGLLKMPMLVKVRLMALNRHEVDDLLEQLPASARRYLAANADRIIEEIGTVARTDIHALPGVESTLPSRNWLDHEFHGETLIPSPEPGGEPEPIRFTARQYLRFAFTGDRSLRVSRNDIFGETKTIRTQPARAGTQGMPLQAIERRLHVERLDPTRRGPISQVVSLDESEREVNSTLDIVQRAYADALAARELSQSHGGIESAAYAWSGGPGQPIRPAPAPGTTLARTDPAEAIQWMFLRQFGVQGRDPIAQAVLTAFGQLVAGNEAAAVETLLGVAVPLQEAHTKAAWLEHVVSVTDAVADPVMRAHLGRLETLVIKCVPVNA